MTAPSDGSGYGSQTTPLRMLPKRPRIEAYLTGQSLALACATGMPLHDVARVNRALGRFSSGGGYGSPCSSSSYLTEESFSALLARCELGAQETRWLYCALDREGGGKIDPAEMLMALMAFYSGEGNGGGGGGGGGSHASVGLMDLRVRYQREVRVRGERLVGWSVSQSIVRSVAAASVVFCLLSFLALALVSRLFSSPACLICASFFFPP